MVSGLNAATCALTPIVQLFSVVAKLASVHAQSGELVTEITTNCRSLEKFHEQRVTLTHCIDGREIWEIPMPRDGAIIFGNLTSKLDALRVSCSKCERDRSYAPARLINQHGRDVKVTGLAQ
jgi:hypothetical protein